MSLLPIPRPERAEGTVLAALLSALLSALLAVMLVVQFVLSQDRPASPVVPPVASRAGPAQIAAVNADPALARRSIFQPTRLSGAGTGEGGTSLGPLGGAYPAGIVRVRGAARLVLQTPGGNSVTLRPGQSWQGWRLIGIGRDEVRFRRAGETITLNLGASDSFSYPGYGSRNFDPRGYNSGYQPNQADEQ